jgi:hypothetical protein
MFIKNKGFGEADGETSPFGVVQISLDPLLLSLGFSGKSCFSTIFCY